MDLLLSKDDPLNTVLVTPDGCPMYHVDTPIKWFGKGNTKITNVSGTASGVEWHSWRNTILLVGQRRLVHYRSGTLSSSRVFQAGDGKQYKWKLEDGYPALVVNDHSHTLVARFHQAENEILLTPRLASLSITPLGMHIIDDIVTTFIWYERIRRERERERSHVNTGHLSAVSDLRSGDIH